MRVRKIRVALAVGVTVAGLCMLTGSASFGSAKPPKPPKREDITKPGARSEYMVFRNGEFYKVTVKQSQFRITEADGNTKSEVMDDPVDSKEQFGKLPPRDPAFDAVGPTEAQIAEADRVLGIGPDGSPPPPPGARLKP